MTIYDLWWLVFDSLKVKHNTWSMRGAGGYANNMDGAWLCCCPSCLTKELGHAQTHLAWIYSSRLGAISCNFKGFSCTYRKIIECRHLQVKLLVSTSSFRCDSVTCSSLVHDGYSNLRPHPRKDIVRWAHLLQDCGAVRMLKNDGSDEVMGNDEYPCVGSVMSVLPERPTGTFYGQTMWSLTSRNSTSVSKFHLSQ